MVDEISTRLDRHVILTTSGVIALNTFVAGLNQAVHAKTAGSHVALREHNSGAESCRELFKGSKDLASHSAKTRLSKSSSLHSKKFLVGRCRFFVRHEWEFCSLNDP